MSLGDRIKRYEAASKYTLTPRSCLFIRIDGQHFHSYTKGFPRPFSWSIIDAMQRAAVRTTHAMQGFKLAYIQSDEATFLLTDFDTHETQGWFGYDLPKVVSVSASHFTPNFNHEMMSLILDGEWPKNKPPTLATFDSRAFVVPLDDAPNVFVWRQQDWHRNSIQMFARAHFSHKECDRKSVVQLQEMLLEKGLDWSLLNNTFKRGTYILKDGSFVHETLNYDSIAAIISGDEAELPGT